jgi:hypothetical protein
MDDGERASAGFQLLNEARAKGEALSERDYAELRQKLEALIETADDKIGLRSVLSPVSLDPRLPPGERPIA